MRVIIGGAEGLLKVGDDLGIAGGLMEWLRVTDHVVELYRPGSDQMQVGDLFVAFVDGLSKELLYGIQDAAPDMPVLCVSDNRAPPSDDYLVAAGTVGLIEFTCYRDFGDLCDKVLKYMRMVSAQPLPRGTAH